MHRADAELTALGQGELTEEQGASAQRHLAECPECARRFGEFRATDAAIARSLRELDHEMPRRSADAVIARAMRRPRLRHGALAAGITALVIAGTAAAAMPGSPIRRYVQRLFAGQPPVAPPRAPDRAPSGVAFVPEGDLEVAFRSSQRAGVIRITVSDSPTFRITHAGGSAGYALTDRGVLVENAASSASYQITLPRAVTRARVRVGGRLVFSKDGPRVATTATRDGSGAYVITLPFSGASDR